MTHHRRMWTLLVAALMLFAGLGAGVPSRAQDGTPSSEDDPSIETTRTTREEPTATPDPAADEPAEPEAPQAPPEPEGDIVPGQEAVIAQGLAVYDDYDEGKWWLTEIEPLSAARAESTVAPAFGFLLQIEGTTIIRNDVTGKRARTEPGEAYYFSAGDAYTRYSDGSDSRAWLLEIVRGDADEEDSAGNVRYVSDPPFDDLPSAVRDLELTAGTLAEGQSVDVEVGDAPSLIIVVSSRLRISGGSVLNSPAGFAVAEPVTLTNETTEDAQYYVAILSSEVISDEAPASVSADDAAADASGTPIAGDAGTDAPEADPATGAEGTDTDGDGVPDDVEIEIGTDPEDIDTDNDGLNDGEEVSFTSPLLLDSDEDGWDDYAEVVTYGTDPNDPNSYPVP